MYKLVLAPHYASYRAYLNASNLSPHEAKFVKHADYMRGYDPDKLTIVKLHGWESGMDADQIDTVAMLVRLGATEVVVS